MLFIILLQICQILFLTVTINFSCLSTMSSCIFSWIHLFYKLCSDFLDKDLLVSILVTKSSSYYNSFFLQCLPDLLISHFIISLSLSNFPAKCLDLLLLSLKYTTSHCTRCHVISWSSHYKMLHMQIFRKIFQSFFYPRRIRHWHFM